MLSFLQKKKFIILLVEDFNANKKVENIKFFIYFSYKLNKKMKHLSFNLLIRHLNFFRNPSATEKRSEFFSPKNKIYWSIICHHTN